MVPDMHVLAAILLQENLAIARHENRNRIGHEEQSGRYSATSAIKLREIHTRIVEVHGVHQVVQRYMGVVAIQPAQQRKSEPAKSDRRLATKRSEQQVEPNNVRLEFSDPPQQPPGTAGVVERPATMDRIAVQFRLSTRQLVGQYGQAQEWILP